MWKTSIKRALAITALLLLAACGRRQEPSPKAADFPVADRPVANTVSGGWSEETRRDSAGEARKVMNLAGIARGMTVADIGAGEGYYTVRLAKAVGKDGRVLAEDVVPAYRDALARRIERERLDNVSVRLGLTDNPRLPPASFDRVFMVHMYHEVAQPYAFLWHIRSALKPDGRIVVVDVERPIEAHGTPERLLKCEFEAVGYRMVERHWMPEVGGYLAMFQPVGSRPDPNMIKPCDLR